MRVYGYDTLQISNRGRVVVGTDAVVSHEHDGLRWVKASDMRALLKEEVIEQISGGRDDVRSILRHISLDLDPLPRAPGALTR